MPLWKLASHNTRALCHDDGQVDILKVIHEMDPELMIEAYRRVAELPPAEEWADLPAAYSPDQHFYDTYCGLHYEKFGEYFRPPVVKPDF